MQILQCTSLKNNYLYRIQIILADIQAGAYNFMIKRIPRGFTIFMKKNEICYVFLPAPHIGSSFSRGHQTVTVMNLKIYYWILAKDWDARGTSSHSALMGNCPNCCHRS